MTSNGVRVLQVSADRSSRGILFSGTAAAKRQEAYARAIGELFVISFSRVRDGASERVFGTLRIIPTNSYSRFLYILDAYRKARHLPKPDVVSAQDPFETGLAGWLLARHFGVPLHVQIHTDLFSPSYARLSIVHRLRVLVARFVLRRAARIRTVSDRIKQSLIHELHIPAERVSVLPIYVDIESLRNAPTDSALAVTFAAYRTKLLVVSRLEPEKHVALALRALRESAPPSTCLIIVGSGSEQKSLMRLAETLGIAESVFFEGAVEAAPYYRIAELVLVTSRFEGYGLVIIEALASGVPVLSTDVGIAHEAGAIIASEAFFGQELGKWFSDGPRSVELRNYPYEHFDAYVNAYAADLIKCARGLS